MQLVHKPKQDRSKDSQEKLLTALESLLEERFFEQITIRDIAQRANLSTATIYRRFKNKEALLPILYQRYDHRLSEWAETLWLGDRLTELETLESRIKLVVKEHVGFYKQYIHILRTLYMYNRLHGELSLPNIETTRPDIYKKMLAPLWDCLESQIRADLTDEKVRFLILILLSSINERFLFENNKPSSILQVREDYFIDELSTNFKAYLLC